MELINIVIGPVLSVYKAPVLILVFAAPDVVNDRDYALTAENMMITAHSLGIGAAGSDVYIALTHIILNSKSLMSETAKNQRQLLPIIAFLTAKHINTLNSVLYTHLSVQYECQQW